MLQSIEKIKVVDLDEWAAELTRPVLFVNIAKSVTGFPASELETREDKTYYFNDRLNDESTSFNLKARTLGNWKPGIGDYDFISNRREIGFVIGVERTGSRSGGDEIFSPVSAYEVCGSELGIDKDGATRVCFFSTSESSEILYELGLVNTTIPKLKIGYGSRVVKVVGDQ
jgi:hypothetical protein